MLKGQQIRIKAGGFVIPMNFATVNLGAEYLNKKCNASWQLFYSFAAGSVAADAGETNRNWLTAEHMRYAGKGQTIKFIYTAFTEIAKRTKYPGYINSPSDSIPKKRVYSEVCPGVGIGFNVAFNKHIGLQAIAGPKFIVTTKGVEYLTNANTQTIYSVNENRSMQMGFRFTGCIYYQFSLKKSSP
jgi:hypothetical protein